VSCFLGQGPIPIKEWNTRPITPLQEAERVFIEAYRAEKALIAEGKQYSYEHYQSRTKIRAAWSHLQQIEGESNG
jgi:hypothetical protein